ncbi:S8 family serine peptidase [Planctomycetaceae bacterium SH139]
MESLIALKRRRLAKSLRCERLESRQLLAGDFGIATTTEFSPSVLAVEAGGMVGSQLDSGEEKLVERGRTEGKNDAFVAYSHFYEADGRQVGMTPHPNRLAIEVDSAAPLSIGELLGELAQVRSVHGDVAVYESATLSAERMAAVLQNFRMVTEVSPVFVIGETGSETVLMDEVIVALDAAVDPVSFFADRDEFSSYRPLRGTTDQFVAKLAEGVGEATLSVSNRLGDETGVAWAEPNFYHNWQRYYFPNDPLFSNQWHLHNTGQGGGLVDADQDLPEAWDIIQGGSPDIVIGIYDDGVAIDHQDLNHWENSGETVGNGIDDDGNGWIDDIYGWNFVNDNSSSYPTTATDRHGTAVAGVAAAIGDNAEGVAGSSYGSPVISARLFDGPDVAGVSDIAEGLYYLAGRTADGLGTWDAADVVNNSWGGGGQSTAIAAALAWGTTSGRQGQGATFLFATGNNGSDTVSYPAFYTTTIPGVVAVGAHNNFGVRSAYSQHGPDVDIVAASSGGSLRIETTDRLGSAGYSSTDYTGTGSSGFGGTSSATPLATGITALLLAEAANQNIDLTPTEVRQLLRSNTDLMGGADYDTSTGKNYEFGFGSLNAASLVGNVGKAEISILSSSEDLASGVSTTDFGVVDFGKTADYTFYIRNQGTELLDLTDLTVASGPYSIATGYADAQLGPGESTTFTARYIPVDGGDQSGEIEVISNDSDEPVFTINATGTVVLPSLAGTSFEDSNMDGNIDPGEEAIADVLVYLDANGNDTLDFDVDDFTNTNPVDITGATTIRSEIEVPGLGGSVVDVNVALDITHTFNSDLEALLIAPDGTEVLLFSAVGDSSDNFTDTIFDDSAELSIMDGNAPFTGSFRPMGRLASLVGVDPQGTWALEITDTFGALDDGVLNDWGLSISSGESATLSSTGGIYTFFGLPAGEHTVRASSFDGWTPVSPLAGEHTVTISDPADSFLERDFGVARDDRFYATVFDDVNGDGVFDASETGLAGRTVFIDDNEDGIFQASVTESYQNTTPVDILDIQTATSEITVAGFPELIDTLLVRLDITHTWTSDIEASLVGPDGTVVSLVADRGADGDNFTDTVFDDSAANPIASGNAPFTGSFRPEEPLSAFTGLDPNGVWTLEIFDDAVGDTGTLNEWELIVSGAGEVGLITDEHGNVAADLPAGSHRLMLDGLPGWQYTSPASGYVDVTTSGVPLVNNLFGTRSASVGVAGVTLGDGSAQRSMLGGLEVAFGGEVTIAEDAFAIERVGGGTVTFDVTTELVGGNTVATLAFIGGEFTTGSLNDGEYLLMIDATKVTDAAGDFLDGDGDGEAGGDFLFGDQPADDFFRMFGDINASRSVNFIDFLAFRSAFGSVAADPEYDWRFDVNSDDAVNFVDFLQFRTRFGT